MRAGKACVAVLTFFVEEVERVMGIEPTYQAWEARVLPLNYTRESVVQVGQEGRNVNLGSGGGKNGSLMAHGSR